MVAPREELERSDRAEGFDRSTSEGVSFTREAILRDYRIAYESRRASVLGRREVFSGKAKFGIFGDGKEVAQVAMARAFGPGDWRSGYYRDQTVMFAVGELTLEEFFAQLYADPSVERDPASAGRQMNAHFASRLIDADGAWRPQAESFNVSADLSPTGSQMPRLVGLAYASVLYRRLDELADRTEFSDQGDEIAFGTIGNASCAEGMFWESINAIGVLGAPALISIWDDGYGISVPNEYQVTRDISDLLEGFQRQEGSRDGFDVYRVKGWDYAALCETYLNAAEIVRLEHVPAILHVVEMTQPQGHSTSGSHERYKSDERLAWEEEHDCIDRMRRWTIEHEIAGEETIGELEAEADERVRSAQRQAWEAFQEPIREERRTVLGLLDDLEDGSDPEVEERLGTVASTLDGKNTVLRRHVHRAVHDALVATRGGESEPRRRLVDWRREQRPENRERYDSHLTSESSRSALNIAAVDPRFSDGGDGDELDGKGGEVNGFEVVNACFDAALDRHPNLVAFGEDVGKLGDVNQGMAGLQEKYGELRVSDTGIRETTIIGQAIGLAMRGIRPIAEIQYLDYLLYCLQIVSDDLATLRYRTRGGQKAPVVIRTRGHRLEGIWHAGSPMAGILNLVRGVWVCVPRDMTRAAGMYNTLLQGDDPAIVVEVLNGYRIKERIPSNIGEFTVPLGMPEVLRDGADVTVVTYGACCRIVAEAAERLADCGIECEVIDVQTLLPFDREELIVESVKKTGRVVFVDEDVPGGATAYMAQRVVEEQGGFWWLDAEPVTVTAKAHRPAYGSDGDYFSKPSRDDVFDAVYGVVRESDPGRFPAIFG